MEKWEIDPPLSPKLLDGDVGNPYPCALCNISLRSDKGVFALRARVRRRVQSDSASFFVMVTPYIQAPCTDFHDQYVK